MDVVPSHFGVRWYMGITTILLTGTAIFALSWGSLSRVFDRRRGSGDGLSWPRPPSAASFAQPVSFSPWQSGNGGEETETSSVEKKGGRRSLGVEGFMEAGQANGFLRKRS